jgi:hypothetical protein
MRMFLHTEYDRQAIMETIRRMNIEKPMVINVDPVTKKRSSAQNSMQWVALLGDFSMQGLVDGRQFSAPVWHEYLKGKFLPEKFTEGKTMKGYVKYIELPDGSLKLVGSTTKLTTSGFTDYMDLCYGYGACELGICFTANPSDY